METVSRSIKKKGITERIGLTLLLIVLSRLGTFIPIPGVDHDAFYQSIATNPIVSFLNVFLNIDAPNRCSPGAGTEARMLP